MSSLGMWEGEIEGFSQFLFTCIGFLFMFSVCLYLCSCLLVGSFLFRSSLVLLCCTLASTPSSLHRFLFLRFLLHIIFCYCNHLCSLLRTLPD